MQVSTIDNEKTMTSREIAEYTGKEHKHVIRDIRKMLEDLKKDGPELCHDGLGVDHHREDKDARGYTTCFTMPKYLADLMLEKYKGLARVPTRLQEEAALKTIEQLRGVQLIRQFQCLSYRIDGYDSVNNIAYEIDEPAHTSQKQQDAKRQKEITAVLGCTFVRIAL